MDVNAQQHLAPKAAATADNSSEFAKQFMANNTTAPRVAQPVVPPGAAVAAQQLAMQQQQQKYAAMQRALLSKQAALAAPAYNPAYQPALPYITTPERQSAADTAGMVRVVAIVLFLATLFAGFGYSNSTSSRTRHSWGLATGVAFVGCVLAFAYTAFASKKEGAAADPFLAPAFAGQAGALPASITGSYDRDSAWKAQRLAALHANQAGSRAAYAGMPQNLPAGPARYMQHDAESYQAGMQGMNVDQQHQRNPYYTFAAEFDGRRYVDDAEKVHGVSSQPGRFMQRAPYKQSKRENGGYQDSHQGDPSAAYANPRVDRQHPWVTQASDSLQSEYRINHQQASRETEFLAAQQFEDDDVQDRAEQMQNERARMDDELRGGRPRRQQQQGRQQQKQGGGGYDEDGNFEDGEVDYGPDGPTEEDLPEALRPVSTAGRRKAAASSRDAETGREYSQRRQSGDLPPMQQDRRLQGVPTGGSPNQQLARNAFAAAFAPRYQPTLKDVENENSQNASR